uniref:Uncharacterized protein n=1 Tax=Arundo donax TaxID=35708 RepID=A0A0A8ZFN3_ARUDO
MLRTYQILLGKL